MTVSEALAAHATARIASAKDSDSARNILAEAPAAPRVASESRGFIESWSFQATVIGWTKAEA
jgi:hypothetical protein